MCGLFGLIRNENCDPAASSAMCIALGFLAEERGIHSAGLAMATGAQTHQLLREPLVNRRDVTDGGWRIVKGPGRFRTVWDKRLTETLCDAPAVLGHTRWATQGDTRKLANASPLQVGQLIGAHNGDVDAALLRESYDLPEPKGQTDTESLFQALDAAAGVIMPTVKVLEDVVGRAALTWTDRRWPDLMMFARTAISPLSITLDTDGNLYWASNPGWFAKAAKAAGVTLKPNSIWLVPEGTLLLVDYSSGQPRRVGMYEFTATARAQDDRMASIAAYRGFTLADEQADRRVTGHVTLPSPTRTYTGSSLTPLWMSA